MESSNGIRIHDDYSCPWNRENTIYYLIIDSNKVLDRPSYETLARKSAVVVHRTLRTVVGRRRTPVRTHARVAGYPDSGRMFIWGPLTSTFPGPSHSVYDHFSRVLHHRITHTIQQKNNNKNYTPIHIHF